MEQSLESLTVWGSANPMPRRHARTPARPLTLTLTLVRSIRARPRDPRAQVPARENFSGDAPPWAEGETPTSEASAAHPSTPAGDRQTAHVVGTLCENNDWFARSRDLPAGAAVGDLFVIHDTGAHSHSMGFQYNGKLRAPELLLRPDGTTVDVIRQRESLHCLFDNTIMPPGLLGAPPKLGRPEGSGEGKDGPAMLQASAAVEGAGEFPYSGEVGVVGPTARATFAALAEKR